MVGWVAIVTVLAVLFYFRTAFGVGQARRVSGVAAPAMTGHETLERAVRVQMNTLEWMPIFLPLLWLATLFPALGAATPLVTSALGLVWIAGRWLYMLGYMNHPSKRSTGFMVQGGACVALMLLALVGAGMRLAAGA